MYEYISSLVVLHEVFVLSTIKKLCATAFLSDVLQPEVHFFHCFCQIE